MRGNLNKYLQDSVVTMRQDRYVIPVKSEYRSFVKGFIHDQSSSGATVFIEPEHVMELNNDLKRALLDEQEEIHKILAELSNKVSYMAQGIRYNAENISEVDSFYARAQYSFVNKCSKPILNDKGIVEINRGRHPLIDKEKVVPVSSISISIPCSLYPVISYSEKIAFISLSFPWLADATTNFFLFSILQIV
jgi:DNA mismatch repair protein MutS2